MKKQIYLPALILFLCFHSLMAQKITSATQDAISKIATIRPQGLGFQDFREGAVDRTEGSPYFEDDWRKGSIRFEGQPNFSEDLEVLLDFVENSLYVRLSSGFTGDFPMKTLDAVAVISEKGDTLIFESLNLNHLFGIPVYGNRFYRILHRGDRYLVLHQPIKYLRREEYVENLGAVRRPDKFMERNQYWVLSGKDFIEIKRNQRSILKAFPKQASIIKRLTNQHALDLKKTEDIGILFSLLE